jgi:O-antigen/teichoic acid export membrane protein
MFAALLAVPWLMHYLGQERLGVLSLVWVVVGYFSFLDMGLGRAVTVAVAPLRPSSEQARREELHVLGSASTLLFGVGATAAVVLAIGIDVWGVPFQLSSDDLRHEVTNAILWTLPSLPLLLLSSSLRGYLEGVAAFRSLNLVRIPTGILLVAGPCLTAFYTPNLIWACICIAVVRLMHAIVLLVLVANQLRHGYSRFVCDLARASSTVWLRRLLTFGGWVTVSNVVGPVIIYVDRFVIGATLAASAVTAYAVPFDLVSRLPILVASVCSVLLPELARLSGLAVMTKPMAFTKANQLVKKSTLLSVGVVAGIALLGYFVTPWALEVWLGPDFRKQSTQVTRILLLAFGVNAVAQIPFTALQAVGKVRAVAMLHSAELVPYAALVFFAITWLGIEGAAWAWLFRSVVDYIILALMWHSHTAHSSSAIQI